jgi:hypothetical protein
MEYWREELSLAEERQEESEVHFARLHMFKVIIPEMKLTKYTKYCFKNTEAKMTFKDVDKKDCCCQREDESTKAMLMSWKSQGTTKVMSMLKAEAAKVLSRVTSTRSDWRIWDPGRSEGRA